ncbi:MAG: 3-dehydroquinate dehydratase [Bacteroidetes bacterium]|nr:3-dehydroquinate dehydratase [Bacteroidota bacterium]
MKISIINGPNLNLTGKREPEIYGNMTFQEYLENLKLEFPIVEFQYFQSNIEGELIDRLQLWGQEADGIILNAGGYTHTSVALGDTVKAIDCEVIEVHISNILARESYRHISLIAPSCKGIIAGFGMDSYRMAVVYLIGSRQ